MKRKRNNRNNNNGYNFSKKFKFNSKKNKGKRELYSSNQSFGPGKLFNFNLKNGNNNDSEKIYQTYNKKGYFSGDSRYSKYIEQAKENPKKAKAKKDFFRAKKNKKLIKAIYKKVFNVIKELSRTFSGSGKNAIKF